MLDSPIKRVTQDYVVLINLGTPKDTRLYTIQKYLFEFLFDPCVIDMPFLPRLLLVGGVIVPTRSFSTRKSYKQIFTAQGSPLMIHSQKVIAGIQRLYSFDTSATGCPKVILAMRYGKPSIKQALSVIDSDRPLRTNPRARVAFIPLYPQAAMSTTGTVEREIVRQIRKKKFKDLEYRIAPPFYRDERYLDILASSIRPYLDKNYDHILFSYHGIPERHLIAFDPNNHCLSRPDCCQTKNPEAEVSQRYCYRHQVYATTLQLVKKLDLPSANYSLSFQSRLGRDPWLTPYTDKKIVELAEKGVKKLLVVCPAFVSDNLETLFEIAIENKEIFQKHGGESLTLIPCLNDKEDWIRFLKEYAEETLTLIKTEPIK